MPSVLKPLSREICLKIRSGFSLGRGPRQRVSKVSCGLTETSYRGRCFILGRKEGEIPNIKPSAQWVNGTVVETKKVGVVGGGGGAAGIEEPVVVGAPQKKAGTMIFYAPKTMALLKMRGGLSPRMKKNAVLWEVNHLSKRGFLPDGLAPVSLPAASAALLGEGLPGTPAAASSARRSDAGRSIENTSGIITLYLATLIASRPACKTICDNCIWSNPVIFDNSRSVSLSPAYGRSLIGSPFGFPINVGLSLQSLNNCQKQFCIATYIFCLR